MHYPKKELNVILCALIAVPIGAVIGAVDTLFGRVLLAITDIRGEYSFYLIPFLAFAGILIVFCYTRYGGKSGRGMSLVFEVGHGEEDEIPLRLIPFVMSGTWLTHLFGGSAGREGVAVQLGATISHGIGKRLPIENASKIFLVTGMAAGFAGLFRTPIAATAFALEVLVAGELELCALVPALVASYTASTVSQFLGLEKFSFIVETELSFTIAIFVKMIVLGIIFGMVGALFAWGLKKGKDALGRIFENPIVRIAVTGALLSIIFLLLYKGRYSGLGTNLIHDSFYGERIYVYDWILKLILTIVTLSAGFQGGEVTPLFSIGASLGVVLAGILGLPVALVAGLGYAAVFGGATNTLLAPIFIGVEVFGYEYLPYFFIVCAVGYMFNGNQTIYTKQKGHSCDESFRTFLALPSMKYKI